MQSDITGKAAAGAGYNAEYEKYQPFYQSDEGVTLLVGQNAEFSFDRPDGDRRCKLFVTGETGLFYMWKSEPDYPMQYRKTEDAFDTEHAYHAQYCLNLSNAPGVDYIKRIYKKVMWPPELSYRRLYDVGDEWNVGLYAKTEGLRISEGGFLRMRVEVYMRHTGVSPHSTKNGADEVYFIDITEGEGWRRLAKTVKISKDAAHVGILIEGLGYEGTVYIEKPFLEAQGYNMLPDFTAETQNKEKFAWTAWNLSRKEWPEFRVSLNGTVIFSGEKFERCHCCSEWTVPLPGDILKEKDNKLEITLISDYHDPVPYTLRELGIVSVPDGALTIVACPEGAPENGTVPVLIRTREPDSTVVLEEADGFEPMEPVCFPRPGLNVVRLRSRAARLNASFTLRCGDTRVTGAVPRIVEKKDDGVITGTGDLIYVLQEPEDFDEYLSWYMSNGVGNMLTIRPTYRWSGTRTLNETCWRELVRLLNEMDVRYAHMLDGRELPGMDANPAKSMLEGKGFLGRQGHENDGKLYYWWGSREVTTLTEEQYLDLFMRVAKEHPDTTTPTRIPSIVYTREGGLKLYRDTESEPRDMRAAHDITVGILRALRADMPRHTGPSVMFKYFYEAGQDFVGAETMYTSMEPLLAFMRGAAHCWGKTEMGVHHAVQWSTWPHDTPERFRRFRLALYISYMQGVTQINTEEGLWHLEEYYSHFHRFSDGCRGHLAQQRDFYRYISTHSRTGSFYTPMALLHGRFDGWHGFGHDNVWGWPGAQDCDAEKSWDMLKVFYPKSKPGDGLYLQPCPNEAVGYYSGTPRGNVDVLPVESPSDQLARYGALAFMGYNCAEGEDIDRLLSFAKEGGSLIMGWAHLNCTTDRAQVEQYRHHYAEHPILDILGGRPCFITDSYHGAELHVGPLAGEGAEVLARTDNGYPLLLRYSYGDGALYWLNAREYPGNPAVRPLYERLLADISDSLWEKEPVSVTCGDDVQTGVFIQENGQRHVYVLATDWYREPEHMRRATLRLSSGEYPVELPFGVMLKIVSDGQRAAWCLSEEGEVLELSADRVRVQGAGRLRFAIADAGTLRIEDVCFDGEAVKTLSLKA